ncbi:amidohydrolase [Clostridium sp. AF18-27]|uniref:amidohydrolase n=1 Tax=Enterocloster lavalensis TaxID=460384 RepID=UPI000E518025|nr:amidohydrolase [Enterocloster lavalensis]RHR48057.1 amidohydrolase [Clostridium sp. AF18-27]
MKHASYIIKSSAIFTAAAPEPVSGAVVVAGNRILAVVPEEEIETYRSPDTTVIDAGSRLVMPGFNDAHMHFSLGAVQNDPDFCIFMVDCRSEAECVERVRIFAEEHPDNPWIYGWGWYCEMWENPSVPSRDSLDALGLDRPVCLSSFDLHTVWCNGEALKKMEITRHTPQPAGGLIARDEAGEPSGILKELPANKQMVDEVMNVPDLKATLLKSLAAFRALGITAIADVYPPGVTNPDVDRIFADMESKGELTCRVSWFPDMKDLDEAKRLRDAYHTDRLRVAGVKQILDGVVEAHTACMSAPYEDRADCCGEPMLSQEELNSYVLAAAREGFPGKLHTIGDKAVTMALDAYEHAGNVLGSRDLHHSIEHAETISSRDINRLADLNVLATVQPIHSALGMLAGGYQLCLGEERAQNTWPFREILDAGGRLAFSTDYPAAYSINPLWNVYSAVTRCEPDEGAPADGRSHTVTLAEALTAYTKSSAYAETFEDSLGTLEPGKLADIVIIDRNLFAIDPMEIRFAQVDLTMVDGEIRYERA